MAEIKNRLAPTTGTNAAKNPLAITFKAGEEDVTLSPDTVKKYLVSGDAGAVTTQEIVMFMNLCKFQHLNPFLKEAYIIKYGNQPASLVVGKNAFEKRAARCEKFQGFEAGVIVINNAGEVEKREGSLVIDGEVLVGGYADIYIEGYAKAVSVSVSFNEYAGRKKDGTLNSQWASKPATMIRKVAKVQALREAFPEDFAGMYAAEELSQEQDWEEPQTSVPEIIAPPQPEIIQPEPPEYTASSDEFAELMGG